MVVFPNAKINLGLEILRKREDGFHDIRTIMVGVDWCDVLEVVPGRFEKDTLTITGNAVNCPLEKNLVIKAINTMRQLQGTLIPAVDIYLHKNIPDGAGLGGGSSDAAFTIKAVNKLFELDLTEDEMAGIASEIGSDCPFFIYDGPMLATGRGEILTPVDGLKERLQDYDVLIVKSDTTAVSTAEAYGGVKPFERSSKLTEVINKEAKCWASTVTNDFEASIFKKTDSLRIIKDRMYRLGATYSSMTGSGSAVFGLFRKGVLANVNLSEIFPDCKLHIGKVI